MPRTSSCGTRVLLCTSCLPNGDEYIIIYYDIYIIIINLLSWRIFRASGGWPVLSPLSSYNPPYPLHPVTLLPSFLCLPLPHQSIISLACLSFPNLSIFNSNTFFISTSSSLLTICPNHLNLFCFKCSSKSFTPTLDAITVLSTLSFNVTPQIILSILLSVARSL